jgi:hypothetical protein
MDAGGEEDLVDVEIAEARQDLLRHQQGLDRAAAAFEQGVEPREGELRIERIGSQPARGDERVGIVDEVGQAEETHVLERQPPAAVECKHDLREARLPGVVAVVRQIAGHPEVEMQPGGAAAFSPPAAETRRAEARRSTCFGEEMLAVPPRTRERAPLQFPDERLLPNVREDALVAHVHARDALLQRVTAEVARVGLDFR